MHLVFITQKIDESDDILGFTGYWVRALSQRVDRLTCIALTVGDFANPPANVTLHSLNKEKHPRPWLLAVALERALARVHAEGPVDAILAHMAPVYAVLSAPLARWYGTPIYLWYTHRVIDVWLRMATRVSRLVFTASDVSFRLPTPKRRIVGHGIPLSHFDHDASEGNPHEIVAVARLSPVKKLDVLVRAMSHLSDRKLRLRIVGDEALGADRAYRATLESLIRDLGVAEYVIFEGSVPHSTIPSYYARAVLSVDPCAEGFDKAVLESMAARRVVLTANPAFAPLFGADADALVYEADDAGALASKIHAILDLPREKREKMAERLHRAVSEGHGLGRLAERMVSMIREDVLR